MPLLALLGGEAGLASAGAKVLGEGALAKLGTAAVMGSLKGDQFSVGNYIDEQYPKDGSQEIPALFNVMRYMQ